MPDTSRMKPDFAVHLDGTKLQGEEAGAILGIRVYQTRSGASSFEVIVSDPELKWQGKPTFTDCTEVKIELGVPGRMRTVFDGEVTAWRTELERSGPSVLVLRGLDRSHRMMRSHKTRTFPNTTPLDVAQQIATQYGLTAKTRAGAPAPLKTFRFQANQSDFEFLAEAARREGYLFWVEGTDLHFERPQIPTTDDCEFSFGENLETFLPSANFRKPPASVEVSGWDAAGKAKVGAVANKGQGLWTLPGGKHGAEVAAFTRSKVKVKLVDPRVTSRAEAETVAKAALTRQSMEFLTGEVEVQGDPAVKPGAMVNLKKVGAYSGHYLVTEANHFYDSAGYRCIFYVARDKWGSSAPAAQQQAQGSQARQKQAQPGSAPQSRSQQARTSQRQRPQQGQAQPAQAQQQTTTPAQQQTTTQQTQTTTTQAAQQTQTQAAQQTQTTPSIRAAFEAAHFETDKAFPLPSSLPMFRGLGAAFASEPQRTVLVVGHTDSVGPAAHNLDLSEDRAAAIAAYLEDDADAWMPFYAGTGRSAQWGTREDQLMLSVLPYGGDPYYDGEIDGVAGPGTKAAFEALQGAAGLDVTGTANDASRHELVLEYMRAEGTSLDGSATVLRLGCGDRHKIEKTGGASEANRRVDVFLFEQGGIEPPPDDCSNGTHPGCDVYDRWVNAVTATVSPDGTVPERKPKKSRSELIGQARKLHKAMLDARDEEVAWAAESERAAKKYVAEWCEGFAKNDKLKKKIDLARLEKDKEDYQRDRAAKCEETNRRCKDLIDFLDAHAELRDELEALGVDGKKEGSALIQGIGECVAGSAWIEREMEEGHEGFLEWLLRTPDGAEAIKKPWEALEPFLDAAAETVGTMLRVHKEEAVEYFARIIAVHFKMQYIDLITEETITVEGGIVKGVIYQRKVTVLTLEKIVEHEDVEAFAKKLSLVGKLVAGFNFFRKLQVVHEDPSFKNVVGAVGAFSELLGATETATSFANKLKRAGRTVTEDGAPEAVETLAEAGEVAVAKTSTKFVGFLAESMAKKLNVLAVVAGAADAVTGGMEAYEEAKRDNIPGAVAKGAVGVGGALMAVAGTMEIFGLAADSTVLGLPAGVAVGILGLIVGMAGAVASFWTEESALEEWADHCEYGNHRRSAELKEQIEDLDKALYQVRVKGSLLGWPYHEIEIEPTCLTKVSRVTCLVEISSPSETRTPRKLHPLTTDDEKCRIEFGEDELQNYVKKITLKLDIPQNLSGEMWTGMKVTLMLDPDASGKSLERTAELKQGVLDWILSSI